MARTSNLPNDRIILLVCLIMSGVVLLSLGVYPGRNVEVDVLGSPLGVRLSARWLIGGLLIVLTSIGMDGLVRTVSRQAHVDLRYSSSFWILPGLVTLAAASAVPAQFGQTATWLGSLLFLSALLALVVVGECGTVSMDSPHYRSARLGLNVATYSAALALYISIYGLQVRSLISATAVIVVTFPMAIELLRSTEEQLRTTWMYAGIIALVTGELTWPLNALGLRALFGGALILLTFYTLTGIVQQHLAGRLNRAVALEFGTVAAAALGLVALGLWAAPRGDALDLRPPDGAFLDAGAIETSGAPPIPQAPVVLFPPSPFLPVDPWLTGSDVAPH